MPDSPRKKCSGFTQNKLFSHINMMKIERYKKLEKMPFFKEALANVIIE